MFKLQLASHKRVGKERKCVGLVRIDKETSCQSQMIWDLNTRYIKHVILYANRKNSFVFRLKGPTLHLHIHKE